MSDYTENRKHMRYYKYVRMLLGLLSYKSRSILDVGSNGFDLISWLPCPTKVSIDMVNPVSTNGVVGVKANFLNCLFNEKFDIVTCFQVMEHIDSLHIHAFADKLLSAAQDLLIVSVPYNWKKGACKYHRQDPVDESKFLSWFSSDYPLKPAFSRVIYEEKRGGGGELGRLVVVFASSRICESLDALNEQSNWLLRYEL